MAQEKLEVVVQANHVVAPFRHPQRAFGYACSDYTYEPPTLRMYDYLSSYAGQCLYMRMHGILTAHGRGDHFLRAGEDYGFCPPGTDRVVQRQADGGIAFDWTMVDRIYDPIVRHGMKLIVETHGLPSVLRKNGNYWQIADYAEWEQVLSAFVQHLIERYGLAEVQSWYFEVWNEPDHVPELRENPEPLLRMYDHLEHALHAVDAKLRVGGPATMQGPDSERMFRAFVTHCARGRNFVSGARGTRVDFVSVHCKGGGPGSLCPSIERMFSSLEAYADILKEFPELAQVEFMNDESDVVWGGNLGVAHESWLDFRNTHYFPGFVAKMLDHYCRRLEDRHELNVSVIDSDNCHLQWEKSLFSGNRSQLTPLVSYPSTDLLKKPMFNGYVLLSRLGSERLAVASGARDFGTKWGALATRSAGSVSVLLYNFEDGMAEDVNERTLHVRVDALPWAGPSRLLHYRIDTHHSNAYTIWKSLGRPNPPTHEQIRQLREREGLELAEPVQELELEGTWEQSVTLPMHAVSLLVLVPENLQPPAAPALVTAELERGLHGTLQVFLKWTPDASTDFLHYRLVRRDANGDSVLCESSSFNTATYVDMDVEADASYEYRVQSVNASGRAGGFSESILPNTDAAR